MSYNLANRRIILPRGAEEVPEDLLLAVERARERTPMPTEEETSAQGYKDYWKTALPDHSTDGSYRFCSRPFLLILSFRALSIPLSRKLYQSHW